MVCAGILAGRPNLSASRTSMFKMFLLVIGQLQRAK